MYISFLCVDFIRVGSHFSVEYGLYTHLRYLQPVSAVGFQQRPRARPAFPAIWHQGPIQGKYTDKYAWYQQPAADCVWQRHTPTYKEGSQHALRDVYTRERSPVTYRIQDIRAVHKICRRSNGIQYKWGPALNKNRGEGVEKKMRPFHIHFLCIIKRQALFTIPSLSVRELS